MTFAVTFSEYQRMVVEHGGKGTREVSATEFKWEAAGWLNCE